MIGSIDRPEGGRFRLRMYVTGVQQTIGFFDTRRDAELAAEAHEDVLKETAADYEGLTVSGLAQKLLTRREITKSVRDPDSDWSRFNVHIKSDMLGHMALKAVQTHHISKWIRRLEDKKIAPSTRRNF